MSLKLFASAVIPTAATSGAATGIVVQYGSLLVIDPILIVLGIIGYIAAWFRYDDHTVGNRVSGLIIGIILANFSSLGVAEFALSHGFTFLNPHVSAVIFGFSGSSFIDLWEKWIKRKEDSMSINVDKFMEPSDKRERYIRDETRVDRYVDNTHDSNGGAEFIDDDVYNDDESFGGRPHDHSQE